MPRFPKFSSHISDLPNSVFEKYKDKFRAMGKNMIPFHLGDTFLQPPFDLPLEDEFTERFKYYNRYCNTYGISPLLKLLGEKVNHENGFSEYTSQNVMITHGAINGLQATLTAIVEPGEHVMALTPCWPFFLGMVKMGGAEVIEVPFYQSLIESDDNLDIEALLESSITSRTVALYVNSPNNPTGKILTREQMGIIGNFAKKHQLWVISDEAYEHFIYEDKPHIPFAVGTGLFDQTITIYTFSKSFLVAGFRLGYLVAQREWIQQINKTIVHEIYSASSVAQYMMLEAVKSKEQWLPKVRETYRKKRDLVLEHLQMDVPKPEAGYYFYFSLGPYYKDNYSSLFEKILDAGVALAPGGDFGHHYPDYVRLCFTSTDDEKLIKGIERLNQVIKGV